MSVSRRGFLKFGLGAALAGAVSGLGFNLRPAFAQAKEFKLKWTKQTTSICCYCAVGCGLIVSTSTSDNPLGKGRAINVEGDPDHPINEGSLCPKGASTWQLTVNDQRPKKPLYRAPPRHRMERSGMGMGDGRNRQAREGKPRQVVHGKE